MIGRYVRLTNATLIPEMWLDTYEWFAGKEAQRSGLSEWQYQHRKRVPKWVGKGKILGAVIYV